MLNDKEEVRIVPKNYEEKLKKTKKKEQNSLSEEVKIEWSMI